MQFISGIGSIKTEMPTVQSNKLSATLKSNRDNIEAKIYAENGRTYPRPMARDWG